jgi:hypothetical protein
VEDQALHVSSQIDEGSLGLGTFDTNGPYEQCHVRFLLRKDMFDPRTDLGFDPVGGTQAFRSGLAHGLLAVDATDPTMCGEPCLIGL